MWKLRASTIPKEKKLQSNKLSEINKEEFGGNLNGTHMWEHFSMSDSRIRSGSQWQQICLL